MKRPAWTDRGTRDDVTPESGGSGAQPYYAMIIIGLLVVVCLGFCLWSVLFTLRYF